MERFQNPSRPVPLPINNFLHGRDGLCSFVRSLERERERESVGSKLVDRGERRGYEGKGEGGEKNRVFHRRVKKSAFDPFSR